MLNEQVDELSKVEPFIQRYRDSLQRERDASNIQLDQQRRNDQGIIMSNANTAGMMYSNFPARAKTQYNVNTYNPNLIKVQSAYTTGLNDLRNKGVELANYLKQGEETISDYNYYISLLNSVK